MERPAVAGKALGVLPLVKAVRAYSAGVECVPGVIAAANPEVFLAGSPGAQRTADFAAPADVARLRLLQGGGLMFHHGPILHHRYTASRVHPRLPLNPE